MTINNEKIKVSLGEAASRYLATVPEDRRVIYQQEVLKFVRWFGTERSVIGLTASEVSNYAERLAQMDADAATKIEPIKAFLAYIRKERWNPDNLATGIKIKKSKAKTTGPAQKLNREPIPMTKAKYDELAVELKTLQAKRIEVIADIQRAAADKDFRENAPFHAAREQKGHIEGRIMEIDETLACAVITEESKEKAQIVCVGDMIVLEAITSQQELRYKLVNPKEVAPSKGMISTVSPIGRAVVGKTEGEVVIVVVPSGKMQYRIKRIEH
ncbi:MAG TPA: transcription elongation factor GreA [Dehalococcoidales bacterium]